MRAHPPPLPPIPLAHDDRSIAQSERDRAVGWRDRDLPHRRRLRAHIGKRPIDRSTQHPPLKPALPLRCILQPRRRLPHIVQPQRVLRSRDVRPVRREHKIARLRRRKRGRLRAGAPGERGADHADHHIVPSVSHAPLTPDPRPSTTADNPKHTIAPPMNAVGMMNQCIREITRPSPSVITYAIDTRRITRASRTEPITSIKPVSAIPSAATSKKCENPLKISIIERCVPTRSIR